MIYPYVKPLTNRVYKKTDDHQPRCISKDGFKASPGPITGSWRIQQPGLRNQYKRNRCRDSQIRRPLRVFFPRRLTENIRDEKRGCKQYVAQSLLHTKGVDQKQHFDVGCDRRNDRTAIKACPLIPNSRNTSSAYSAISSGAAYSIPFFRISSLKYGSNVSTPSSR